MFHRFHRRIAGRAPGLHDLVAVVRCGGNNCQPLGAGGEVSDVLAGLQVHNREPRHLGRTFLDLFLDQEAVPGILQRDDLPDLIVRCRASVSNLHTELPLLTVVNGQLAAFCQLDSIDITVIQAEGILVQVKNPLAIINRRVSHLGGEGLEGQSQIQQLCQVAVGLDVYQVLDGLEPGGHDIGAQLPNGDGHTEQDQLFIDGDYTADFQGGAQADLDVSAVRRQEFGFQAFGLGDICPKGSFPMPADGERGTDLGIQAGIYHLPEFHARRGGKGR